MTDIAKIVLEKHQVRKNRRQKDEFIKWVAAFAKENGYKTKIEKSSLSARNIVFGNPETAKVIYTAHYDTCAAMPVPNFITPTNMLFYLLYQLLLVFAVFAAAFCAGSLCAVFNREELSSVIGLAAVYIMLGFMIFGPANKHTANDNTSGVVTVLELMERMPQENRDKAAFVLFDFEEVGLIGSASFQSTHKKQMKDKLIVNFDCVSDGKDMLFAVKKQAKDYVPMLKEAFKSDENFTAHILSKGVFYPSDQVNFKLGVGVAALKKSKSGILYMDKIHTKKDTVFESENIEYFVNGSLTLTQMM